MLCQLYGFIGFSRVFPESTASYFFCRGGAGVGGELGPWKGMGRLASGRDCALARVLEGAVVVGCLFLGPRPEWILLVCTTKYSSIQIYKMVWSWASFCFKVKVCFACSVKASQDFASLVNSTPIMSMILQYNPKSQTFYYKFRL